MESQQKQNMEVKQKLRYLRKEPNLERKCKIILERQYNQRPYQIWKKKKKYFKKIKINDPDFSFYEPPKNLSNDIKMYFLGYFTLEATRKLLLCLRIH